VGATVARGLAAVLAVANGLLLLLMGVGAKSYFAHHSGGETGVALAVVLLGGGLTAGLVGERIASKVPTPGPRWRRTAAASAALLIAFLLLCAGSILIVLLRGAS